MCPANVSLAALVFALLALLLSQVPRTAGAAAGLAGALMVLAWLMDGAISVANAGWLGRLSPLYYYDQSKPLIPTYGVSGGGMLTLAMLALLCGGVSLLLFLRRDIGGVGCPGWLAHPWLKARDRAVDTAPGHRPSARCDQAASVGWSWRLRASG